ncbi:MAG: hypothetical protein KDD69_18445 [Bdellovibrionales bacterium]|nr:hypothetical protein [Bdellovibrionales bacterium]
MRLAASAYGLRGVTAEQLPHISEVIGHSEHHPVTWVEGDIASSLFGGVRVILLPPMSSFADLERILRGLGTIFDSSSQAEHWILDFSAIRQIPVSLASDLLAFHMKLKREKRRLMVAWLRDESAARHVHERLCTVLGLRKVGGFWFTDEHRAAPEQEETED